MQKLELLKKVLGEDLFGRFIDAVGQKEGAAALIGMVTKETDTEKETEATPEPEKETPVAPVVDLKALTEALGTQLQPLAADLSTLKQTVTDMKTAHDAETASLESRLKAMETGLKEANAGVVELKGEKTRAQNRRPSESDKNVTDKEHGSPAADPDNAFAAFLFSGQK